MNKLPKAEKIYILVRGDLPRSAQAVQAGHALAELIMQRGIRPDCWAGTLVYLKVQHEEELRRWLRDVPDVVPFYEPDLGNSLTALATLNKEEGFEALRLL
jgi:hypothetical protein